MFKPLLLTASAVLALLPALSAHAQAPCLRQSQIWNFDAPNDRTLIVENNFHQKFKVTLMGTCTGLTYREGVGFKVFGGTALSCISPGDTVINRGFGHAGPHRCPIKSVELYTPAMQKADAEAKAAQDAAAHGAPPPPPAPESPH